MSENEDFELQKRFQKIQEELRHMLRYEEDDARALSADEETGICKIVTPDKIAPGIPTENDDLESAYDPEDENFDSGNEVFPYFSDGEIVDSDDSNSLQVLKSSENENSARSPIENVTTNEEKIGANDNNFGDAIEASVTDASLNDSTDERYLLEEIATLELRKAALASITLKSSPKSTIDKDVPAIDTTQHRVGSSNSARSSYRRRSSSVHRLGLKVETYDLENETSDGEMTRHIAAKMLQSRDVDENYHSFVDCLKQLPLRLDDHRELTAWEQEVMDLLDENEELEKSENSNIVKPGIPAGSTSETVIILSSDSDEDISVAAEWIVIDDTEANEISSHISSPTTTTRVETNATENYKVGETDGKSKTREKILPKEVVNATFPDEQVSDVPIPDKIIHDKPTVGESIPDEPVKDEPAEDDADILRQQLLNSIALKRLPQPVNRAVLPSEVGNQSKTKEVLPHPSTVSPLNSTMKYKSILETNEKSQKSVSDSIVSVDIPDLVVPAVMKDNHDRKVFLSSRKNSGPPRRFVIRVDNDSSEEEVTEKPVPDVPCDQITSFIKSVRQETTLKKSNSSSNVSKLSSNFTAVPGKEKSQTSVTSEPAGSGKLFDRELLPNIKILHRKIVQEQNELMNLEVDLRRQQSSLARMKFNRGKRIEKLHKLLRTVRRHQTDIEGMTRHIDKCKTRLATDELAFDKKKLTFARKKELLNRVIRLRNLKRVFPLAAPTKKAAVQPATAPLKVDPFVPLCPYFLHGSCLESACEFQHLNIPKKSSTTKDSGSAAGDVSVMSSFTPQYISTVRVPEKLGLVIRTWCRVCRIYVTASTQHLRTDRHCTTCVNKAQSDHQEDSWLAVLHHALCRVEALRLVEMEPGGAAVQSELTFSSELGDQALAALPDSLPIIEHGLSMRRAARRENVPLGLLKPLLSRTRLASLVWQCLPLVPEAGTDLLRYTLKLENINFQSSSERLQLVLALARLEEESCNSESCSKFLCDILTTAEYPLSAFLDKRQRAVLWLCLVHLTQYGYLPPASNLRQEVDCTMFDVLTVSCDSQLVKEILQEAVTNLLAIDGLNSEMMKKMCCSDGDFEPSVRQILLLLMDTVNLNTSEIVSTCLPGNDCDYEFLRRIPLQLNYPLDFTMSTSSIVILSAHWAEILLQAEIKDERQIHESNKNALTLLSSMVRYLYSDCESAVSEDVLSLLLHYLGVAAPDKHNRVWLAAEPFWSLSPSAQAFCLAVPVFMAAARSLVRLEFEVEILRVRALSCDQYLLFGAVVLRNWFPALGGSILYEELVRGFLQHAVLAPGGSVLRLFAALTPVCQQTLCIERRHRLATEVVEQLSWSGDNAGRSLLIMKALCQHLVPEPVTGVQICEHALVLSTSAHNRSTRVCFLWQLCVQQAAAAEMTATRRLDLLKRATSASPRCRQLWLEYLRTARAANRTRTIEYIVDKMRAEKLEPDNVIH